MCGSRKWQRDDVPDQGRDMVRMRGNALAQMHRADADEEIEALEEELDDVLALNDRALAGHVAVLIDTIAGLEDGSLRASVPAYDPDDERATKVGHENPIEWVRRTERKVREAKRLRRIS